MTVKLDKVADSQVRQDARGIEVTRKARLTGISGNLDRRTRAALEAQGLPRYGDPHPAWGQLRLVDIILIPVGNEPGQWDATLTYRVPTAEDRAEIVPAGGVADISWFATTVTEERVFDFRGNPMWHYYTGFPIRPQIIGGEVRFTPATTRQIAIKNERASVQKPSIGARVLVIESRSIQQKLWAAGSVNRAYWSGYPPRTWLLGAVDSRLQSGRWHNTYTCYYNRESWLFKSVVDWAGTVPSDARVGNGIAFFEVYEDENWNNIGFTL